MNIDLSTLLLQAINLLVLLALLRWLLYRPLQAVIAAVREQDFPVALSFVNFRD